MFGIFLLFCFFLLLLFKTKISLHSTSRPEIQDVLACFVQIFRWQASTIIPGVTVKIWNVTKHSYDESVTLSATMCGYENLEKQWFSWEL